MQRGDGHVGSARQSLIAQGFSKSFIIASCARRTEVRQIRQYGITPVGMANSTVHTQEGVPSLNTSFFLCQSSPMDAIITKYLVKIRKDSSRSHKQLRQSCDATLSELIHRHLIMYYELLRC